MATLPRGNWFQPGEGIAREVITADIQRYLGPDALVRPGKGNGEYAGVDGYWITAYRTLTSEMVQDLRLDSQRWRQEVSQGRGSQHMPGSVSSTYPDKAVVAYQDSRTHQSRQYYGPTAAQPADPYAQQQAPQVQQQYAQHSQYAQPVRTATYGEYTAQPPPGYAQQSYVPAPTHGHGQVRTQPAYPYAQPGTDTRTHHQAYPDERYGSYSTPSTATHDPYARQQAPSQPPYYAADGTYYNPTSSERESRRRR